MEVSSRIFRETLKALNYGSRVIINQGGQYSGKTVNILGVLGVLANNDKKPTITTVTSMSFPHLKGGALRDFETYVYPTFASGIVKYNKTDHSFLFKSGSIIEFKVYENEFKARGNKRHRLFVNEANTFPWLTYWQLSSRSEQILIDYNPTIRFWAHENLIGEDGTKLFISDHRHNPFLTQEQHWRIENICQFKKDEFGNIEIDEKTGEPIILKGDYGLWKVYARGLTGNVTGVIFPNWEMIDDDDFPKEEDCTYSIDFGYTNDPTAIVKQCKIGGSIFLHELGYRSGMPPKEIKSVLLEAGFDNDNNPLYCEHDPEMIYALQEVGLNAQWARKGPGSIKRGIELLKEYRVFYTASSKHIKEEQGKYIWDTEKDTGRLLNIPIDANNHLMDAIRYGAYTRYLKNQEQ